MKSFITLEVADVEKIEALESYLEDISKSIRADHYTSAASKWYVQTVANLSAPAKCLKNNDGTNVYTVR